MSEAVLCAIVAAVSAIIVGVINALAQKKSKKELSEEMRRNKEERLIRDIEKEKAHKEFQFNIIKGMMASLKLSEATAKAVKRIPDAHCNGDMDSALAEEAKSKKEIEAFIAHQGIENIN